MSHLTRRAIIDAIVADVTADRLRIGDNRDSNAPPIAFQNFYLVARRHGAKALRAHLSRLSYADLRAEFESITAYHAGVKADLKDEIARLRREEQVAKAQSAQHLKIVKTLAYHRKLAYSEQQRERARRPRLQRAILAAARHYRSCGMNAKEAWDAIKKSPFSTNDGDTVEVADSSRPRTEQVMRHLLPDRRQPKRAIRFSQWRQRYWTAAT